MRERRASVEGDKDDSADEEADEPYLDIGAEVGRVAMGIVDCEGAVAVEGDLEVLESSISPTCIPLVFLK